MTKKNIKKVHTHQHALTAYLTMLTLGILFGSLASYGGSRYFFSAPVPIAQDEIEICFSPKKKRNKRPFPVGCTESILATIEAAQETIHVAMFSLASLKIANALKEASKRGIQVYIIVNTACVKYPAVQHLIGIEGIKLYRYQGKGIMHLKNMIVDGRIVCSGSFNWSKSAESKNRENWLKIKKPELAKVYLKHWDKLKASQYVFEVGTL